MASTFEKLNLKDHQRILVLNAPASFEKELNSLRGVEILREPSSGGEIGFSLAFVTTQKEADALAKLVARKTKGDAVVWFAYPKGASKKYKSEISRDTGWEELGKAGFECVRLIAIDEDWTASRFRRAEFIKTMTRDKKWTMSAQGKSKTRVKKTLEIPPSTPRISTPHPGENVQDKIRRRDFINTAAKASLVAAVLPYANLADHDPKTITLAAVGDCMITRPLSSLPPDEFLPLAKIIQSADVSFGNFEMTLAENDAPPQYHDSCAYVHLRADLPENRVIAEELKWAGFKIMGMANNHAMDYGTEGLASTIKKFDAAAVAHAGTGQNLSEARSPGYWDGPRGRVSLVACASTFPYGAFAADGNGEIAPRPGLNPCRVKTTYRLSAEQLASLRTIAGAATGATQTAGTDGTLTFLGHKFVAGSPSGIHTEPDPDDLAAITAAVRRASRNSDLTLFGIHAHEGLGSAEIPAEFLRPLAHACIDAGANAFIGHGPHVLRGIEIYKGRPIFYSLGNFIFHGESAKQIPPEIYATCGVNGTDPSDVFDKVLPGFSAEAFWISVIAVPSFRGGVLTELKLHPVVLQSELPRARRGTPTLATGDAARKIIEKLAKLSEPYGTAITFEDGMGSVRV